jgi:hypothetical protein
MHWQGHFAAWEFSLARSEHVRAVGFDAVVIKD